MSDAALTPDWHFGTGRSPNGYSASLRKFDGDSLVVSINISWNADAAASLIATRLDFLVRAVGLFSECEAP